VKEKLLDILAAISILFVGLLALGFFGGLDVLVVHTSFDRVLGANTDRGGELGVDRERVVSYWMRLSYPATKNSPSPGFSFSQLVRLWPPQPPELKRSIWEFDAHFMSGSPGPSTFILACPIWCAMVPFLIAPALWVRKRRKKRQISRGFAVGR